MNLRDSAGDKRAGRHHDRGMPTPFLVLQAPKINFLRAGKDLTEMILKSKMQKGLPFLKKVTWNHPILRQLLNFSWSSRETMLPFLMYGY